ncbi:MAG: tyrosinase family protein [Luteimonas sp.]
MYTHSRRHFIRGLAAMPVALWLARSARADIANPLVRCDIATPQGAAMLQVYADAVGKMKARTSVDPLSWMWWWYLHFVDGNTTKAAEIARLFGDTTTPLGALADQTWNTCQAHSGQNYNNFMPWHRMALMFLENIIRQVSGVPDFAMPYWNYTSNDPAQRAVLPAQFRMPLDPIYGSLYRPDRTKLANTGQSIQLKQPTDVMDLTKAMSTTSYSNVGKVLGFCRAIDSGVHGSIHALVGNGKNMGKVPFAARDPLFWVHHSNVDRMWASWNANGGQNPTTAAWATAQFVFPDPMCQPVTSALKDYFDIATLGYTYDALIPPPAGSPPLAQAIAAERKRGVPVPERLAVADKGAELGARAVRVPLRAIGRAGAAGASAGSKRSYLVVSNLHAWTQPEVLYHLYLTASGTTPSADAHVGSINFFDAEFHDHGHGMLGEALGENFYSFDVTALLQKLARLGSAARDGLDVTFVPAGTPNPAARPLVATIELVRQ